MKKPLLIVKNITHEAPGLIETALSDKDFTSHVVDLAAGDSFPDPRSYKAVVVLGGPQSANDLTPSMLMQLARIEVALQEEIPYLGICLGMQTLVKAGGGKVLKCPVQEIGFTDQEGEEYRMLLTAEGKEDPLFCGLSESIRVFQLHGETVELAAGMKLLASGRLCPIQAVKAGEKAYGLQCHAEMTLSMFLSWLALDADLKSMDRTALIEQFESFRHEYTATGIQLINNFLRISGLAHD
ncbi:type 1 glutamine amidotransferase [Chlorobium sp. BLA1]|uniref:type 1 glutamine amidotransferase n=1 Tax=Candidatus Chlorobium masyuteum TaxID=2716876 RepID=UPI00141F32B3|nr:type 1 glutamine amidotransferase [Candidatus Chlorobium masyuteum]NHQ60230.1 type 1 glutamine amidotransferase [Candidatus Chlorobium masyuteum]NTU44510.1 type 1 glutamine amidotransferase [Chlorobiaceae bacterium]